MSETIQTKRCSQCKQFKSPSEFYKHATRDYQSYCKLCKSIKQRAYRKTRSGKLAQKRYSQSEKGKSAKKRGAYKYNQSKKGKFYQQLAHEKHPKKYKARKVVNHAIEAGKLPRPDSLQCHYYWQNPDCEKQAKHYHHHLGYEPEHWLDVVPVCVNCHSSSNLLNPSPRFGNCHPIPRTI